jgi:hypothetical protein
VTRTVRTSLGTSPLSGSQAVSQTQRFKDQLLSLQAKPESVSLITVQDADTQSRGVVAVYDADDPAAREWANLAESLAPEIWLKLAERRKVKTEAGRGPA